MIDSYENYTQIDDIIDAQKKLGRYNIGKHPTPINYRYAYSSAATTSEKFIRFDDVMLVNEGDHHEIKTTDSEITVVRVRTDGMTFKRRPSKWDMHDVAIPGDGSHLGESPSMVNLATLVKQNDEYLVPLSSWDPYYNGEDSTVTNPGKNSDSVSELSDENTVSLGSKASTNSHKSSIGGRISKFLRKHMKKAKTMPEQP